MVMDEPEKPRHLIPVPRPKVAEIDMIRPLREWWRSRNLGKTLDETTLAQAMSDVGVLSLLHMAKRLSSPKTPERVKDQLAMAIAPKVAVQVVGKLAQKASRDGTTTTLLDAYGVTKK